MQKKLLKILRIISKDIKKMDIEAIEILDKINFDKLDITTIVEELQKLEFHDFQDEDELDILKAILVYILIKEKSFEKEEIYSLIFGGGRSIIWN